MLAVLVLLVVGIVLGNLRWLPASVGPALDLVLVRVSLPGLILAVVPRIPVDASLLLPAVVAWAVLLGSVAAVWVGSRLARLDRRTTGTLLVVVPLSNTGFLGFPAVEALLGPEFLPPAIVYDQVGSFLALATLTSVVAARYGRGEPPGPRTMARRVATFPPLVFLVIGLALAMAGTALPAPLQEVADIVGATVTPLAMLAVGLRLRLAGGGWRPGMLAAGLGWSMLLAPALVYVLARAVGMDAVWQVSVLETAMPPMVMGGVIAAAAGLDDRLAAQLVAIGAVASMATLPAWALLLT
ncbi:AEC family transporter [Egicoccus halophilus]|uniref:Malate permease n=1 Tax=Egicoccus halophilus TaxID=1670830 RepID=A0A8J3AFZ3_9ACTN|nr:AEC family transporter [Egicoccus halophilus]GGI07299.1 malate permease [Egicoccus halophilus]